MLTVRQRYGQTDGRTDGRLTIAIPRFALRASRGKNCKVTIRTCGTAELYVCEGNGSGSERGKRGAEEREWGSYTT